MDARRSLLFVLGSGSGFGDHNGVHKAVAIHAGSCMLDTVPQSPTKDDKADWFKYMTVMSSRKLQRDMHEERMYGLTLGTIVLFTRLPDCMSESLSLTSTIHVLGAAVNANRRMECWVFHEGQWAIKITCQRPRFQGKSCHLQRT